MKGTTITVGSAFPWGIVIGVTVAAALAVGGSYWYYRSRRGKGTRGLGAPRGECPCKRGGR